MCLGWWLIVICRLPFGGFRLWRKLVFCGSWWFVGWVGFRWFGVYGGLLVCEGSVLVCLLLLLFDVVWVFG